jgi:hypothetical protein
MVGVGFGISRFRHGVVEVALAPDPAGENQAAHHCLELIDREEGENPRIERVTGRALASSPAMASGRVRTRCRASSSRAVST